MWENAEAAGALIVFAEHRYYGLSQPFGSASSLWLEYMTHEQALADYSALLLALRAQYGAEDQPTVVFGGSYGGKLAAWMRVKYPGAIAGAIAASAPVLFFEGTDPSPGNFEQFWRVVTRDMTPAAGAAAACAPNVRAAWDAMDAAFAEDPARLAAVMGLCAPLGGAPDVYALKILHLNAWDTCAMGNFPYPSNYLTGGGGNPDLPAWPVRAMCSALADASLPGDKWALLAAFNAAGAVFNNATENVACYALPTDLWLDGIWDYQYCASAAPRPRPTVYLATLTFLRPPAGTETLPEETYFTRDGVNDAFWPVDAFNKSAIEARCFDKFGVKPRWTWIVEQYGSMRGGTNIAYTNGGYDPWSSGGVLPGSARDTPASPAFLIPEGAHHLDLFFSNPQDPPSVTNVRLQQVALIAQWAAQWRAGGRGL
jgi:lysosomal Pro-X carboxypeptidase